MIFIASLLTMRRGAPRKSLLFVEPPLECLTITPALDSFAVRQA